jgi:hypothetical protein
MEINMQATIGLCNQYQPDPEGEKAEISVVISAKKVIGDEKIGKLQFIDGCNMFNSCWNKSCWYSVAGRQNKKNK